MTAQPTNVNILRAPSTGNVGNDATCALAFDPRGDFIVAIGEKGQAVVWDVEKCVLKTSVELNGRSANCVAWSPDGAFLLFGTDKGPVLVSRGSWLFDCLLEDATDKDDDDDQIFAATAGKHHVSAAAFSANGKYLLTATADSSILLWDAFEKKVLACWKIQDIAQKIVWHPTSNAFILIDKIGQWGIVPDVVPPHMPSPHSSSSTLQLPDIPEASGKGKRNVGGAAEDEEDNAQIKRSKAAKLKRKKQQLQREDKKKQKKSQAAKAKKKNDASDEELEDQELENGFTFNPSDIEADDEEDLTQDRSDADSVGSHDSYEDSASDEDIPGELADLENGGVRLPSKPRRKHSRSHTIQRRGRSALTAQAPFMPSSTPAAEKDSRKRRILAWNLVGAVLSLDEQTHNTIEIEFAEATQRTVGIRDHYGYSMSSLTSTGVFLASKKKKEHTGLVTFRPFSSWANNSDWTQTLSPDEDVSVIALGQRFAAVATTPNNIVRLFSLSGIQTAVFGVPGNIITVAANGDRLVIVFVEPGSSVLKCEFVEISCVGEVEKIRYSGNLMMCSNSKLEWVGFTNDTGELCSYDSNGWLWVMTDVRSSQRWVPLMQNAAKVGECDWFWVASATSTNLIGVPCLSNERCPAAKPRPALRSLPLFAPVIERLTRTGKPAVIERYARTRLNLHRAIAAKVEAEDMYESDEDELEEAHTHVSRMELEADKCVLWLMEDACKRELNMRALDLSTRLHCKVSFKYATELALHYKRSALASRVEQVAMRKLEVIEDEERLRQGNKRARTSPVTPPSALRKAPMGEHAVAESDRVTRAVAKAQATRMDFSTDGEDGDQESEEPKAQKRKELSLADLSDDEEEIVARVVDTSVKTATKAQSEGVRTEVEAGKKKREATMIGSQASVIGEMVAKKARTNGNKEVKSKASGVKSTVGNTSKGKRSFHNRFLKK